MLVQTLEKLDIVIQKLLLPNSDEKSIMDLSSIVVRLRASIRGRGDVTVEPSDLQVLHNFVQASRSDFL